MTPLVSQLWPQFMADPDFAASFGRVIVEHARMLRQERQVVFTLRRWYLSAVSCKMQIMNYKLPRTAIPI